MHENKVANAIYNIGLITIVVGIIGGIILGKVFPTVDVDYNYLTGIDYDEAYNWGVMIGTICASIISGIVFFGFAEIIELLYQNQKHTKEILDIIKGEQANSDNGVNSKEEKLVNDIEQNLPKM